VPVVFALEDEVVYTAVDAKPKTTQRLRRLANIERNPQVSLLVDHYAEDWSQLWWVRIDGIAAIHHDGPAMRAGLDLLRSKYAQYQTVPLIGPVIAVAVQRWSSWHA
jgi:PPOX class probable F420-dependent enzyme